MTYINEYGFRVTVRLRKTIKLLNTLIIGALIIQVGVIALICSTWGVNNLDNALLLLNGAMLTGVNIIIVCGSIAIKARFTGE